MLNKKGAISYIVANKWIKANYGKPLRKYLKSKQIKGIIDLGIFACLSVEPAYPCIISIYNKPPKEKFKVTEIKNLNFISLKNM